MSSREKLQADFDLERFIDMFDEALTSDDERVVNALRSLMMMVILTKSEARNPMADHDVGPLRQLYDDLHNLNRRLHDTEERVRSMEREFGNTRSAKDYWDRHNKWNLRDPLMATQISEEDYKHIAKAIHGINTPGKL